MKPRFTCSNRPSNCQLHQLANCCVCSRRRSSPSSSRRIPCNRPACSRPCHHQIPDYDAYDYPDQRACCSCCNGYDDISADMYDVNNNNSYDSFDDEHDSRITNFSERSRPSTNSSRSEISDRSERSDRSYKSQRSDRSCVSNISDRSQNSDTSQGESRRNQRQHQNKEGNQRTKWSNTKTDGYCVEHECEETEYTPKRRAKVTCSHIQYYPSDDICSTDLRPLCDGNRLPSALRQPKDSNQNSGKETKITQKPEVEGQQSTDDSYTFNISVKPPKTGGSSSDQSQDDDGGFKAQLIITARPQTTGKPISAQLTLSSMEKDGKVEIHEIEDEANQKPDNPKESDKKPPKGSDKQSDGESQMSTKQSTSGQSKESTKPSITSNKSKGSTKSSSTGGQSKVSTKAPPKDRPQQINNERKMNAGKVGRTPIVRPEERMEMNPNNTQVKTMYRSSAQSDSASESIPADPFPSTNRDQGTIMWQNESMRPNYTNKSSSYTFLESEPSVPFDRIPDYTSSFTSGIKATSSKMQADVPAQNQRDFDIPHPTQDHRLRHESSLRVIDGPTLPVPPGPQISYQLSKARSSQDRPVRITESTSQQSQSNSNPRKSETLDRSSRSNAQPLSNPTSKTQSENRQHNAALDKLPNQPSPTTNITTTNRPQDNLSGQELQRWTSNPPIDNKPLDVILQPKPLGDLKLRSSKEPPKGSRRAKRGQVEIADQSGKSRVKDIPNPERNKDPLSEESLGFIPKLNATVKTKEAPSTSQNKEQKLGKSIPQSLDPKNQQQDQSPTYFNDAPPTVLNDTTKPNPPNNKVENIIENTIQQLPTPQPVPNEAKLDQLISLYEKRSRLLDNDDDEDEVKFPITNLVPIIKSTRISPLTKLQINRQRVHKHKEADNKANRIKRQKEADEVKTIIKPGKNVIMLRPSSDTIHINYVLQTPTIQFSAVPGSPIAKTYISKNSDQPQSSRYYCVCSQRSPSPYQAPVLSRMQQTVYGLPKNRTRKASEYPQNKCTVLPHLLPAKSNKHQQL